MKIKLIDFGVPEHQRPYRPHGNDAGADVYLPYDCTLQPGEIAKIPLGFGLEIPDGYAGYIFPRTSMAVKGLVCELPPVDSGYRGEIHAIISNVSNQAQSLFKGARIGQLVITPIVIADFCNRSGNRTRNRQLWQYRRIEKRLFGEQFLNTYRYRERTFREHYKI